MTYPDGIDALVNVNANDTLAAGGHAARHNSVNTALEELADVLTVPATNTLALVPDGTTERFRIDSAGLITGAGTSLGAWTSYTPTLTVASGTNPTLGAASVQTGKYVQIGKLIVGYAVITFGTSGSSNGSGLYRFLLPVATQESQRVGFGQMIDASASQVRPCQLLTVGGIGGLQFAVIQRIDQVTTATNVDATSPWTWAESDSINIHFSYQAA
jgi:hypothetical protein